MCVSAGTFARSPRELAVLPLRDRQACWQVRSSVVPSEWGVAVNCLKLHTLKYIYRRSTLRSFCQRSHRPTPVRCGLLKDLDRTQSPFAATRKISIEGCEGASI